jgi:hypothetical protein
MWRFQSRTAVKGAAAVRVQRYNVVRGRIFPARRSNWAALKLNDCRLGRSAMRKLISGFDALRFIALMRPGKPRTVA